MSKELTYFLTAIMFFTRIPVPEIREFKPEYLNKASRYLPVVGLLVGGIGAGVYYLSTMYFPVSISIILSMVVTIVITGGFHEDGFTDCCDAFGGGWDKEQVLRIMKDSRVGSFGLIGIVMILLLKFHVLLSLPKLHIILIIIAAHGISRFCAISLLAYSKYVREDESSKSQDASRRISFAEMLFAFVSCCWVLFLFWDGYVFYALIPCLVTSFLLSIYFKRRIGGFTGDCLGAVQQVTEIVFYLSMWMLR